MNMNKLLLAMTALAASSAFAQAPLGTVTNVQGVVTATQGATGVTVTPGTVIQNGMRFVTTNSGSVTLQMSSGCNVTVPPAHGVTVLQSMTCAQLNAAVQPVVTVAAPAATGPAATVVNGIVLLGAAGIVTAVIRDVVDDDEPLSPR